MLTLVAVFDSSHKNVEGRHSQGAYALLLMERNAAGGIGGFCHVLDYSTKRSTRVCKSSFAAETLTRNRAAEVAQRMVAWIREVRYGTEDSRHLMAQPNVTPVHMVTDAHDLWSTIQCPRAYKGAGQSLCFYIGSLEGGFRGRKASGDDMGGHGGHAL